jgi:hypothetical protein
MGMEVLGDPLMPREISCVQILDGCKRRLDGSKRTVISDLLELIKSRDPDLILYPYADTWVPLMVRKARRYGSSRPPVVHVGSSPWPQSPTEAMARLMGLINA